MHESSLSRPVSLSGDSITGFHVWDYFDLCSYGQTLTCIPRSFILANASSLKLPCSTPELTKGIGISLQEKNIRYCKICYSLKQEGRDNFLKKENYPSPLKKTLQNRPRKQRLNILTGKQIHSLSTSQFFHLWNYDFHQSRRVFLRNTWWNHFLRLLNTKQISNNHE